MITSTVDYTTEFNANSKLNLDTSGWDYVNVQVQTPSGSINFNGTNDANAIEGVSDGNARTAINWQPVQGINTATGSGATSTSGNGLFKFSTASRFLQFIGSSVTVTKIIVVYSQID
jgi:hypothetical protein